MLNSDGRIVQPGVWRTMNAWCDAYTAQINAIADARNDPRLKRQVKDALTNAKSEVARTDTNQDHEILRNQRAIAQGMQFSLEEHKELIRIWMQVRTEFMATGWDLNEEISYQLDPKTKKHLLVWQGAPGPVNVPPPKDALRFTLAQGGLAVKFLKFIGENSMSFDPVEYTKQTLAKQGINEHNFDQANLDIVNPWKPV